MENPKHFSRFYLRLKRQIFKRVWLARLLLLGLILFALFGLFILIGSLLRGSVVAKYAGFARDFLLPDISKVEVINDRVNILVLGKSGPGHEGPDLTDTIILASISVSDKKINLIPVPRDVWIAEIRAKINSAYYWGKQKDREGGLVLAKSTVEEVLGIPIQYGVVVDFSVFREVINILEGIEVEVENSFTDTKFPVPGREADLCDGDPEYKCRYETIKFEKGLQVMDGETALKFVRSRNAVGDEGTDLARGKRQEKVIQGIVRKSFSPETFLSPLKIRALISLVGNYVETDIPENSLPIIARLGVGGRKSLESTGLPENLLINPKTSPQYDNLYVFIPRGESWKEINEWVRSILY